MVIHAWGYWYLCMYIYVYTCICAYMCICAYICFHYVLLTSIYIHVHLFSSMHYVLFTYMYIYLCLVWAGTSLHIYLHIHRYFCPYICTHPHVCVFVRMCSKVFYTHSFFTWVCIYLCIYILSVPWFLTFINQLIIWITYFTLSFIHLLFLCL